MQPFTVPTEHFVDVPISLGVEEIVEVVGLVPQARIQQRFDEQCASTTDCGRDCRRVQNCTTGAISERICEKIVDVPVPQVDMLEALQFQGRAISDEIQRKCTDVDSSKEEFFDSDT